MGIPYGDPLADGPTIAAAGQRALDDGMTLDGALALAARRARRGAAPILFFTYVNPIVQYGAERFAAAARAAGALGAIVPDVPLEELAAFAPAFRAEGLAIPLLVAPTTPPERAARIAAASDGFVYIVSRLGVTERRPRARHRAGSVRRSTRLRAHDPAAARGRLRHLDAGARRRHRCDRRRRDRRQRVHRRDRRSFRRCGGRRGRARYVEPLRAAMTGSVKDSARA